MATQVIYGPNNEYVVVDDGASPTYPTLAAGTHLGYDVKLGATSQGTNVYTNGTIPAFLATGTTKITTSAILVLTNLTYKNPC